MFYSKSTGGFYDPSVHGASVPSDAVEITDAEHADLLTGQSEGKRIVADENGRPILADQPAPSAEDLAAAARNDRDARLRVCDWVTLRALDTGKSVPAAWLTYRQALRDVPSQKGFPATITWPTAPEAV